MPQPTPSANAGTQPPPPPLRRGRTPLQDDELTDDEFRKLRAKRLNEVQRTRAASANQIASALMIFSCVGAGATHLLDASHVWSRLEIWTIIVIFAVGISLRLAALRLAATIRSED